MCSRYRFLTLGIHWTRSMPSRDVNSPTQLTEGSWRRDRVKVLYFRRMLLTIFIFPHSKLMKTRNLQWVQLVNRGRLLLRTPCPVPFGTCICSRVNTIFSWAYHVFGLLNIHRYFYFALTATNEVMPYTGYTMFPCRKTVLIAP